MSLTNIGKIISAGSDFSKLSKAVKSIGSLDEAAKILSTFSDLSDDLKIGVLVYGCDVNSTAAKAALGISDISDAAVDASKSTGKLGNALKGVKASLSSFIASPAGILAITVAAGIAIAALVETQEDVNQKAAESAEAYQNTLSEIESLNSELETTQDRIDELNAKENLTLVEQGELAKLEQTNARLKTQIELKEKLAQMQAKEAAQDAANALEKKSQYRAVLSDATDTNTENATYDVELLEPIDRIDATSDRIKQVKELQKEYDNLEKELSQMTPEETFLGNSDYELAQKQLSKYEKDIASITTQITSDMEDITTQSESLYTENGTVVEGYEDLISRVNELTMEFMNFSETGSGYEKAIDGIFSKVDFDDVKAKFITLGQESREVLESELSSGNYDNLVATVSLALKLNEDEAKQMILDYIMGIADPNALNIDSIKAQLSQAFSEDKYALNFHMGESASKKWDNWVKDMTDEDIEILYSIYQDKDTSTWEIEDWENAFYNAKYGAEEAATAVSTLTEETQTFLSQITAVQSALGEQSTGKSISLDTFNSDELKDYQSALEYVNGTYQLNLEKVNAITQAKADEAIATNESNKAQKQSEYLQNAAEIERLRKELKSLDEGTTEYTTAKTQLDNLLSNNSAIAAECQQYDLLSASIREATSAYQNWLNNQNTSESGDMFDSSLDAMTAIDDVADSKSDDYGRVGTKKYKAAVEFIVPDTIDKDDAVAVQNYMDSIGKYFDYDKNGERVGMDITQFCTDAVRAGLMNVEVDAEGNEFFNLADGIKMEDFEDKLNFSSAMVQAFFGEMEEFGGEFDWADEAIETIGDLGVKAYESVEALRSIDGNSDMEIKMDISDIENVDDKISILDSTIQQMNNLKATPGVDVSQIQYANDIIQYCVAQKQQLTEPVFMNIDVSQVDGDLAEIISLVQQLQTAKNDLDIQAAVGADTTEAQGKVDSLVQQIQEKSPEIKATIGDIDTSNVDTILAGVSAKSAEAWVNLGVNDTAITGYTPENKTATVTYELDSTEVDLYNPSNLYRTVTYTVITEGEAPKVNGTAHVNGTAFANGSVHVPKDATTKQRIGRALASGDWGTDKSETALVGELGKELVVYGNRYWTVGDTGAEFAHIPAGSIVFNHKQTEEIFKNGYVTSGGGRGKAYAHGTAYVTGGIKTKNAKKAAAIGGSSSTDKNTAATDKNTDAQKETKDWIERLVDATKREADALEAAIESFEMHENQNKAIDAYVKKSQEYMNDLRSAQNAYASKANAVQLSDSYKKKIRNGTLAIEDITDEDLKEKLELYEKWYITCHVA